MKSILVVLLLCCLLGPAWAFGASGLTGSSGPISGGGRVGDTTPAGPNGTIFGFSLNGIYNPSAPQFAPPGTSIGAVASAVTQPATTVANSTAVTLGAAGDFLNGHPVYLLQGGPTTTLVTPTGAPTITGTTASGAPASDGLATYYCGYTAVDDIQGETPISPINAGTTYNSQLDGGHYLVDALPIATGPALTLTVATMSGKTATFTTSAAHSLAPGHVVKVAGVTPSGYNTNWRVLTTPTTTTFSARTELPSSTTGLGAGTVFGTATLQAAFYRVYCSTTNIGPYYYVGFQHKPSGGRAADASAYFFDYGSLWTRWPQYIATGASAIVGGGSTAVFTGQTSAAQFCTDMGGASGDAVTISSSADFNAAYTGATCSGAAVTVTSATVATDTWGIIKPTTFTETPLGTTQAPGAATAGTLLTYLVSGGGTTSVTLAQAPVQTGILKMGHDNWTSIQNALYAGVGDNVTAANTNVWVGPGQYGLPLPIFITGATALTGTCNGSPTSSFSTWGTELDYQGADATWATLIWDTQHNTTSCIRIDTTNLGTNGSGAQVTSTGMLGLQIEGDNANSRGGAEHDDINHVTINGAAIGMINGGFWCVANPTQPTCDSSRLTIRHMERTGVGSTAPIGFIVESANAGDLDYWEGLQCRNQIACLDELLASGGLFRIDHISAAAPLGNSPALVRNEGLATGGIFNGMEDDLGSGSNIYTYWHPEYAPSQNGSPNVIEDSFFNDNVDIGNAEQLVSIANQATKANPVAQLNAAGAMVTSIGDSIKGPFGNWTATNNGNVNNIYLTMMRNGSSGTIQNQTAESTATTPIAISAATNNNIFKPTYAGVITRLHMVVQTVGTCSACGNTGMTWSVKQGGTTFSCANSATIACTSAVGTELDCVPTTTAFSAGTILTAAETAQAGGACTTQPLMSYVLGYRN